MAWLATPPTRAFLAQLDEVCPERDRSSDGTVGDLIHQTRASSHNPDLTGLPEWRDGDSLDEVRAVDAGKNLNHPTITMEMVVQHLVKLCRTGDIWWIRYIIFNRRIWHERTGFQQESASGHENHVHLTMEFSNRADILATSDYRLWELTGGNVATSEQVALQNAENTPACMALMTDVVAFRTVEGPANIQENRLTTTLRAIERDVAELKALVGTGTGIDPVVFKTLVKEALREIAAEVAAGTNG